MGTHSKSTNNYIAEFFIRIPKFLSQTHRHHDCSYNKYLNETIVKDRLKKISEYHPLNKSPVQGEFLLYVYELMEKPENINEKMLHQAYTVACLIETIQAYFIIQDYVIDSARIRCNLPCWHLLPDVNPMCINDLNLIRHFANEILIQNVDESIYNKLADIFNENDWTDYLDTDGSISGKSSTDIPLGKCTFFAIAALQNCNTEQRKIFKENYGRWDPECIKRILELYKDLNMPKLYEEEMQARYNTYLQKVNVLPEDATPSPDVFLKILDFYRSYADNTSRYYYIKNP